MNKKDLSERDIITQFIRSAIKKVGWNIEKQVSERKEQSEQLMQAVLLREAFLPGYEADKGISTENNDVAV